MIPDNEVELATICSAMGEPPVHMTDEGVDEVLRKFLGVVASSVKSRVNKAVAEQGGHNVTTTCYDYHISATTLKVAAATLSTVKEVADVTVVLGSGNVQVAAATLFTVKEAANMTAVPGSRNVQ
ncbi:hypothetical protein Tco_1220544, partial [Tanacetum coccineum]